MKSMIPALDAAATALQAYGKKVQTTAHNIANLNTEGFKKSRVILEESQPGGVTASVQRIDAPGAPIAYLENSVISESSNVDLGEEMVNLMTSKHAFQANLKILKAEGERIGFLLDIME
jgi:flagellar basal body rod protein FlgG